jgi:formate dehydrogenase subunit delta
MDASRLVYMANQIGKFFVTEDPKTAVAMIADHIKKFWDPRMRKELAAHVEAGGKGLDAPVVEALRKLQVPAPQ